VSKEPITNEQAAKILRDYIAAGGKMPTWPELQYRLLHCDECDCHVDQARAGCACVCHEEKIKMQEVVQCFLDIPWDIQTRENWGTGLHSEFWHCNEETYINGVVMTIDADYMMGYLIEVVDRTSGRVTFYAITTFHGRNIETGEQDHESELYPHDCGTFFDRTAAADRITVCQWAVEVIWEMIETYQARKRGQ
jgi:hypothetical protein